MVALPSVAAVSPSRIRSVVVLPAPFGPRKPQTLPAGTLEAQPVDGGIAAVALVQLIDDEWGTRPRMPHGYLQAV